MDLTELSRRIENMIRLGTIAEVDHAGVLVRVKSGRLLTDWLPWFERRAGATTTWEPPTIGEQCMIFSPSGEPAGGIVLVGINSAGIQPPSHSADDHATHYPDGTLVRYDHVAGVHEAIYPDGAEIRYNHHSNHLEAVNIVTGLVRATTSITFDTPLTHITGKCIVEDLLTYNNGLAGDGGGNGSSITGHIRHVGDTEHHGNYVQDGGIISSNGIVVDGHNHEGVQPGSGISGGPV